MRVKEGDQVAIMMGTLMGGRLGQGSLPEGGAQRGLGTMKGGVHQSSRNEV